jgi:hypothetical protein
MHRSGFVFRGLIRRELSNLQPHAQQKNGLLCFDWT